MHYIGNPPLNLIYMQLISLFFVVFVAVVAVIVESSLGSFGLQKCAKRNVSQARI